MKMLKKCSDLWKGNKLPELRLKKARESNLPPEPFHKCVNCGFDKSKHESANLTDGAFVGKYLLICPTVMFKEVK
jgi:hypothetical protein